MNKQSKQGDDMRLKILAFLKRKEVRISPVSFQEIADAVGLNSTSVVEYHITKLEKSGKIRRTPFTFRSIEVLDDCD